MSSRGTLSAMQEVAEGAPSGRNCFDLLENALLTRIVGLLSAKDLVRFAASCKRFAGLEKECSVLKHAQLCAHFTAAGAADTVAWLTSNRGRVFSNFIVVTGAPYSVLERLVEAPERPPLLFPNSELFAALERRIASDAKAIYTAMANARAVYASTLERGDDADALKAAKEALNEQLDRHRPGELRLYHPNRTLDIWDSVQLDTLQRRGIQLALRYQGNSFSNDVPQWRHSPSGGSLYLELKTCDQYRFSLSLPKAWVISFDNDANVWLLAAGLYLQSTRWLEREVGREDAGYEWQSSSRAMETLRRMSENAPTMTMLSVYRNNICEAGASALAEALMVNTTLTTLSVDGNYIGDFGASDLAEALKENKTLTELNVSYNDIGADGASALADALKVNTTLRVLYVSNNSIGDAGASTLAEALKVNNLLTELYVDENSMGAAGVSALAEALKVNKTLTMLSVSGNSIGAAGASALAKALKVNKTLMHLFVWICDIGKAGKARLRASARLGCTVHV
jgi:Ran GTPase-activating protein (RanGAP) involved in mRNA processing and transport